MVLSLVSSIASKLCHYKLVANSVTCICGYRTVLSSFDSNFNRIIHRIVFADEEVLKFREQKLPKEKEM